MCTWDFIRTYSGIEFHFAKPTQEEVLIADIAHALSNSCRYNGHCKFLYSVAQHSLLVAEYLYKKYKDPMLALQGLHHDDGEAYLPDISRPIKSHLKDKMDFKGIEQLEEGILKVVFEKYGIDYPIDDRIWEADNLLLATEMSQLMPVQDYDLVKPLDITIEYMPPEKIENDFIIMNGVYLCRLEEQKETLAKD